jgi:hypothetical protein
MNEANQTLPLLIGSIVRLSTSPANTRGLGVVKAVHAGTSLFPGWHYDIAWTGRESLDRAVPDRLITPIS